MTEETLEYKVDAFGITDEQAKAFLKNHQGQTIDEIFEELAASLLADGLLYSDTGVWVKQGPDNEINKRSKLLYTGIKEEKVFRILK
jgi:hypothetical protein